MVVPLLGLSATLFGVRALLPEEAETARMVAGAFRMDALYAGVVVAQLVRFAPDVTRAIGRHRQWLPLVAVASLTPVFWHGADEWALYPVRYPLLWFGFSAVTLYVYLLDSAPMRLPSAVARLCRPLLMALGWIGVHSYSIYVWHGYFAKPLANKLCRLMGLDPTHTVLGPLNELVFFATPVLIGVVMFRLVERPMLTVRNRLFPSRSGAI